MTKKTYIVDLCACGCGQPVRKGRTFISRAHANKTHAKTVQRGTFLHKKTTGKGREAFL